MVITALLFYFSKSKLKFKITLSVYITYSKDNRKSVSWLEHVIYIYITHIYMYTYIYVYIYTYLHIYIYTYTYIYVYMYTYV